MAASKQVKTGKVEKTSRRLKYRYFLVFEIFFENDRRLLSSPNLK
jgi:hypothetical protein